MADRGTYDYYVSRYVRQWVRERLSFWRWTPIVIRQIVIFTRPLLVGPISGSIDSRVVHDATNRLLQVFLKI